MKSLKVDKKKDAKSSVAGLVLSSENREYPYGLRLDLNDDTLKKLKMSVQDFSVGDEVLIKAKATVTNLGQDEDDGDRLSLQITDMDPFGSSFDAAWDEANSKGKE